jgi:mannose-6-phosphate isomerase-like protein (cupin superfamily)
MGSFLRKRDNYFGDGIAHAGNCAATYQAGEAFYVDAGKIHYGINSGNVPVKLIATLIVEKGKPPSTPVP